MTKSDVATLLRCCERTVERQVKLSAFPPPQRFGKESLWFQSIVHAWLEKRREEQQQWTPSPLAIAVANPAPPPVVPAAQAEVEKAPKKPAKSRSKEWEGAAVAERKFLSTPK